MQLSATWKAIEQTISQTVGNDFNIQKLTSVSGGSINDCYQAGTDRQYYFVKLNSSQRLHMFETEAAGLLELDKNSELRIPKVICSGVTQGYSFLVLEWLNLQAANARSDQLLGERLALLHAKQQSYYGWHDDNYIGSTHQPNQTSYDWVDFFGQHRLGFQLELAVRNGASSQLLDKGDYLKQNLSSYFIDYSPYPSLMHGDLWGGNYAMDEAGNPVIFDPASYYGDREADIAMTELFGGFGLGFFEAYQNTLQLDPGYSNRKKLYLLYHVLNHFNLFGSSYAGQASSLMDDLSRVI